MRSVVPNAWSKLVAAVAAANRAAENPVDAFETLADVRELVHKRLPAEYRAKQTGARSRLSRPPPRAANFRPMTLPSRFVLCCRWKASNARAE